jgi:hypothetical protein
MSIALARSSVVQSNQYDWYWIDHRISFVLIFLGCWIHCLAAYGFLLGVGLASFEVGFGNGG